MANFVTAKKNNVAAWPLQGAAGWLGLAAAPTFALMASIAADDMHRLPICSSAVGMLPVDSMAWMYLLMSLFHAAPWLKLASGCRRVTNPMTRNQGD